MWDVEALAARRMELLEGEKALKDLRKTIEDRLTEALEVDVSEEGERSHRVGAYRIKVRNTRYVKVDPTAIQDIATQHSLSGWLPELFRWKPEVNKKAWTKAPEAVTRILSAGITSKPGSPSYTITKEDA